MRGRGKLRIWPIYLDATHTSSEGRRVSIKLATRGPQLDEIEKAAQDLDLNPLVEPDMAHPRFPWIKTGLIMIDKKGPKTQLLRAIARKIKENREKK